MKSKAKIYTKKTKADIAAVLSVAGSWKDVDTEAFKKVLYENRHNAPREYVDDFKVLDETQAAFQGVDPEEIEREIARAISEIRDKKR